MILKLLKLGIYWETWGSKETAEMGTRETAFEQFEQRKNALSLCFEFKNYISKDLTLLPSASKRLKMCFRLSSVFPSEKRKKRIIMLAIAEDRYRYRIYMVEVILSLPLREEEEEDQHVGHS